MESEIPKMDSSPLPSYHVAEVNGHPQWEMPTNKNIPEAPNNHALQTTWTELPESGNAAVRS